MQSIRPFATESAFKLSIKWIARRAKPISLYPRLGYLTACQTNVAPGMRPRPCCIPGLV